MPTVVVNSTENTVTVVNSEKRIVVSDSVARGPTGATGVQGSVGAQGATGNTGIQGTVGVQGPTGNRGLFWESTWSQHLNYSPSQAVFYEGNTYICIESNANTIPFGNTTIWDLLAQKGDIGPQGVQGMTGTGTQGAQGASGAIVPNVVSYSALPSASTIGIRAFINDANIASVGNFGAAVSGGGSNNVPVFSDGTSWRVG